MWNKPENMEYLKNSSRDVMVMGRANVDMYVANPGESLETSEFFEKSVGGSAANIAVGLARLGRKVDFLGLVSEDQFGRYVEHFLKDNGIGTEFLNRDDSGSLTSLAFAERQEVDSQVLFYRNGTSDLKIDVADIPVHEFLNTAVLVVTGTGLSASPSREATLYAMETAAAAGTKVVLDLDWRVSAWDSVRTAGLVYRMAAEKSDIILGTRDEFEILLNSMPSPDVMSDRDMADYFLSGQPELVIVKRGSNGSNAYAKGDATWKAGIYPVDVKKNYGAGDAFASALIHGLLTGIEPDEAMRWGAGAAGIVVSDTACAASSPTMSELVTFIESMEEKF